jgi:hypothetical protein
VPSSRRRCAIDDEAVCSGGVKRLDLNARGLHESEGYAEIEDFNTNPVAVFWGEKPL